MTFFVFTSAEAGIEPLRIVHLQTKGAMNTGRLATMHHCVIRSQELGSTHTGSLNSIATVTTDLDAVLAGLPNGAPCDATNRAAT